MAPGKNEHAMLFFVVYNTLDIRKQFGDLLYFIKYCAVARIFQKFAWI